MITPDFSDSLIPSISHEKDGDYYIAQNEQLGIIATGLTEEEARTSFNEEIHFLTNRLDKAKDEELSPRFIQIKHMLLKKLKG